MTNQCEATTLASTYSTAHRCLKKRVKKTGKKSLCAHHHTMEDKKR